MGVVEDADYTDLMGRRVGEINKAAGSAAHAEAGGSAIASVSGPWGSTDGRAVSLTT